MRILGFFVAYLFIESMLTGEFSSLVGGLGLFGEIILSALLGAIIIANFKHNIIETLVSLKNNSANAKQTIAFTAGSLIGAFLLILPGIFSDCIGLLCQIEYSYSLFLSLFSIQSKQTPKDNNEIIIDAEIITTSTTKPHLSSSEPKGD